MQMLLPLNETFFLLLVCTTYLIGVRLYRWTKITLCHPVLVSMILNICFLLLTDTPYESFEQGTHMIHYLLGPTVVSLGLLLYDQVQYLKGNVLSILLSVTLGSFVGIIGVILLGRLCGLDEVIIRSLEPKLVTTPIAMSLSEIIQGDPSLTAVAVVICGISGAVLGPPTLRLLGVNDAIAYGLAMGSGAHGLGTAKAMEVGALEGAAGGLAIGLMGIITSLVIPIVHYFAY